MVDQHEGGRPPSVEDQMIRDWASSGLRRLEHHLHVHARFWAYLRSLERGSEDDSDGADR